uniref:C2H2-type domain-containing protein n=1 Tax=Poecilia reticulata TaxID=8081 RepID=A0A3P9N6S1_POERE
GGNPAVYPPLLEKNCEKKTVKKNSPRKLAKPGGRGVEAVHRVFVLKDNKLTRNPFTCSTCGKNVRQKAGLVFHMRIHTSEKPFSCGICGKGFSQKSNLNVHLRIHTGEKPFSCGNCGKKYSEKRHMRIHAGKKPFSCGACGKCFFHKDTLDRHLNDFCAILHWSTLCSFCSILLKNC